MTKIPSSDYGSVDHYKVMFSDIIADIGNEPDASDRMIAGFLAAIDEWLDYHYHCAENFKRVKQQLKTNGKPVTPRDASKVGADHGPGTSVWSGSLCNPGTGSAYPTGGHLAAKPEPSGATADSPYQSKSWTCPD